MCVRRRRQSAQGEAATGCRRPMSLVVVSQAPVDVPTVAAITAAEDAKSATTDGTTGEPCQQVFRVEVAHPATLEARAGRFHACMDLCKPTACGSPLCVGHNPQLRGVPANPVPFRAWRETDLPPRVAFARAIPDKLTEIKASTKDLFHRTRSPTTRSPPFRAWPQGSFRVQEFGDPRMSVASGAELENPPDHDRFSFIDATFALAEDNLRAGRTVIADCVNPWPLTRRAWHSVAERAGVAALDVEIVCSDAAEHRRRVESREPGSASSSSDR